MTEFINDIRIVTQAVPRGIVPDKYATLLFQREDKKWYAVELDEKPKKYITMDSSEVYLLKP